RVRAYAALTWRFLVPSGAADGDPALRRCRGARAVVRAGLGDRRAAVAQLDLDVAGVPGLDPERRLDRLPLAPSQRDRAGAGAVGALRARDRQVDERALAGRRLRDRDLRPGPLALGLRLRLGLGLRLRAGRTLWRVDRLARGHGVEQVDLGA